MNEYPHVLPFGKHRNKPPRDVDSGYLAWLMRTCKLSSGLRAAIGDVLRSRGVEAPTLNPPTPKPPPHCRRCGGLELVVSWHEIRGQARRVRGDCKRCGRMVGFLPMTPSNISKANDNQPEAAMLMALVRAESEGVELVVRAGEVFCTPWQRATPELRQLVRQSQHALLRHLRREPARTS